jgi:DNA-binding response OmpR family regulator
MARVLIVDDNDDIRLLLRMLLESERHDVVTARSGSEVAHLAEANDIDLVMLDVQMPELDGWSTLTEFRRRFGDSPPVVLCTVKGQPADVARAFELGADGYVVKPFELAELRALIANTLQQDESTRLAHRRSRLATARDELANYPEGFRADHWRVDR